MIAFRLSYQNPVPKSRKYQIKFLKNVIGNPFQTKAEEMQQQKIAATACNQSPIFQVNFVYFEPMKNAQATIRDIAIKLNVSISTVSRALRNAPDINPDTKKAVVEMAAKLNYEPNRVAQSLRIKKTNTLGVIVPEIVMHFFSSAISGIQEYAAAHGYSTMFCQSIESYETEKSNIHMLVANRVDGLLISLSGETKNFDHLNALAQKQIPVVMFDRVADELPFSKVIVDDHDGACKAVEYLIKTGCKRIAYLGGPESLSICIKRMQGYKDALKNKGIEVSENLIVCCEDIHAPAEAVKRLLEHRPDAIFCMNDPMAIAAIEIIKEKQIIIPDEISVVGFTNEPVSRHITPSLTTVSQPSYEMGKVAAELFLEQMQAGESFEPVTRILRTELVIRNSTRKPRS
jgi:DNA-binding LacI/PurR family transcriptional regulator